MALEQKLSLRLSQRLVMTPSLQQAIKLLQMTRMELEGVLNQELEENPVLERSEETGSEETGGEETDRADNVEASPQEAEEAVPAETANDTEAMSDLDLDAYFSDYLDDSDRANRSTFETREAVPIENTLTREPDLYDQLLWQLHMLHLSPPQRELAELVIGNLDPEGFLVATVEELQLVGAAPEEAAAYQQRLEALRREETSAEHGAAVQESGSQPPQSAPMSASPEGAAPALADLPTGEASPALELLDTEVGEPPGYQREAVLSAIEIVQGLDPAGIACWDLRESLLLQLQRLGEGATLAAQLVEQYWDKLVRRQYPAIAKELGVPLLDLQAPIERIGHLDTRPGRRFGGERAAYVEPDVVVLKVGEEYVIQLNDDGMPRLRVSGAYRRLLQKLRSKGDAEARQYLREKMRSAMWLLKSLDQRQRTIYKVAESIVRQQRGFLDRGIDHMRPMVLRDIADDIEMHESTVSRVVSNKYIHTPRGLFPMKFFFHSGIDRTGAEDISSLTVKRKIKNFIDGEDPKKPLSDSTLMKLLKAESIQIARRTVAKYRDELGIPSSTERRQVF